MKKPTWEDIKFEICFFFEATTCVLGCAAIAFLLAAMMGAPI